MNGRPDRPLVVKCTFDRWNKRITFSSARNCSFDLLKNKVEQCFSLYATSYAIAYKDDDGEVTDITTDSDLTEAIQYFQAGSDDPPTSSAASILSGRSFGSRKITLRVHITVDYDGPSLSDTSSLASTDEYKGRNGSQLSFSFTAPSSVDNDDDSVTVSSGNAGAPSRVVAQRSGISETLDASRDKYLPAWDARTTSSVVQSVDSQIVNGRSGPTQHSSETAGNTQQGGDPFTDHYALSSTSRYPEDPSAVFERLKLQEAADEDSPQFEHDRPVSAGEDRGAAWLRDQNARAIKSLLGALPEPSESDEASLSIGQGSQSDQLGGDLALHRDPRGKYYYSYTSASSSAPRSEGELVEGQSHDSGYEDGPSITSEVEDESMADFNSYAKPRPSSMQLTWLASQQITLTDDDSGKTHPSSSHSRPLPHSSNSDPLPTLREDPHLDSDIPPELLQFLPLGTPPSDMLTNCSECGVVLDSIRYVCSACGENTPGAKPEVLGKGKGKSTWGDDDDEDPHVYPPLPHRSPISSSPASSRTLIAGSSSTSLHERFIHKPLPSLPYLSSSPHRLTVPEIYSPPSSVESGYELCSGCIESAGVNHALEVNLAPGTSPGRGNSSPSSPEDAQRALSQWLRSAPKKKGQLRHAYIEKVWAHRGWEDVEQDDMETCKCSTCNTVILNKRYKCASCQKFNLCRSCYSQVHDIHPSHAFLVVPDKPIRSRSEPEPEPLPPIPLDPSEQSMTHPGVKCAHCMLDIVGARFHCAICDSVDICSNCESAGLPGNLDSYEDDSHNSSHIMIKIPYPLETTELQTASRRAANLWTGRDAPYVLGGTMSSRSKPSSVYSSYARTVIGTGKRNPLEDEREDNHNKYCNGCKNLIFGVRYQCGSCPSSPLSYNMCSSCEPRSYVLHDPKHIFFKLPRPVQRPLESQTPFLPDLYKAPAGPHGVGGNYNPHEPKDYLKALVHTTALCDCCMSRINGEWFRCAYCPKDLCDACEALDTHNDSHVFFVFKAPVDMNNKMRQFADLDNPNGSPPVIPYPIYH